MNFPLQVFFKDTDSSYRLRILKKNLCGCFHFIWLCYLLLGNILSSSKKVLWKSAIRTATVSYLLKNNSSLTKCNIVFLLVGLNFVYIIGSVEFKVIVSFINLFLDWYKTEGIIKSRIQELLILDVKNKPKINQPISLHKNLSICLLEKQE